MWYADKLRVEVSLKARYLKKRGLDEAASWHEGTASQVFKKHVSRLNLGGNVVLTPNDMQALPYHLRPTYSSWWMGVDQRPLMSRSKYHRHHKALLERGINIAVPLAEDSVTTISLSRYLGEQGLYYEPSCITVRQKYSVTDDAADTMLPVARSPDARAA